MAQLVKLHNYISRYERNIYHYPSQYIRLKKERWKKTTAAWEQPVPSVPDELPIQQFNLKNFLKRFNKNNKEVIAEKEESSMAPIMLSETEKKQAFLDMLLPFQLKWASSTLSQMSFLDGDFKKDEILKYFLQRFPDTYLLFYHPVFTLKKSTMETDILLVGPFEIDIIRIVETEKDGNFTVVDDRTWEMDTDGERKRVVSPLVSLTRTERVIRSILQLYGNDFPVTKSILSRNNNIFSSPLPYNTQCVDRGTHMDWLEKKREDAHLLKHRQLRVCEILLSHCDSVFFQRPEWDKDKEFTDDDFTVFY